MRYPSVIILLVVSAVLGSVAAAWVSYATGTAESAPRMFSWIAGLAVLTGGIWLGWTDFRDSKQRKELSLGLQARLDQRSREEPNPRLEEAMQRIEILERRILSETPGHAQQRIETPAKETSSKEAPSKER